MTPEEIEKMNQCREELIRLTSRLEGARLRDEHTISASERLATEIYLLARDLDLVPRRQWDAYDPGRVRTFSWNGERYRDVRYEWRREHFEFYIHIRSESGSQTWHPLLIGAHQHESGKLKLLFSLLGQQNIEYLLKLNQEICGS